MSRLERAIEIAAEAHKGQVDKAGNENYDDFIERVRKNPLAAAVKINDLTDNMDIRRLPYLSDKDVKRLKKYLKAYKKLTGEPVYLPIRSPCLAKVSFALSFM